MITAVSLFAFRNYLKEAVPLRPGVNLLLGANAQGKTNLLEAVYLGATGRSPRSAVLAEMVMWEQQGARVKLDFTEDDAERSLEVRLERGESVAESEDHIATLCEVMRYLIASGDVEHVHIAAQKKFFAAHMQAWVADLCAALQAHPQAKFYAAVAHLAGGFFEVEMHAFDMA